MVCMYCRIPLIYVTFSFSLSICFRVLDEAILSLQDLNLSISLCFPALFELCLKSKSLMAIAFKLNGNTWELSKALHPPMDALYIQVKYGHASTFACLKILLQLQLIVFSNLRSPHYLHNLLDFVRGFEIWFWY